MKKIIILVLLVFGFLPLTNLYANTEIKNKADLPNRNVTTSGLNVYIFDEVITLNSTGGNDPEASWNSNTLISTFTALERNTQYTISIHYVSGFWIGEGDPKFVLTSATSSPVVRETFYGNEANGWGTSGISKHTFTTGTYEINAIRIERAEGQSFDNWKFKIQIEKGPSQTDWSSSKTVTSSFKEDSGSVNMWHRLIGNRAYVYMRYSHVNTLTNPATYLMTETDINNSYTSYENGGMLQDFTRVISNPNPDVYTQFEIYEKNTYTNEVKSVFLGNVSTLKSYTFYADGTIYFRDQDNKLIYKLEGLTKAVQMFWSQPTVSNATVVDLPTTTGNPFPDSDGNYGTVYFQLDEITHTLSRTVSYAGNTYKMIDTILDDIGFLKDIEKAFYYTVQDQKFMVFYNKDTNVFEGSAAKKWGGFTVWNLSTNEIVSTNRAWVLTYIDVTSQKKAFAYYYMPEIPVDDLLSVALTFQYRIGQNGITTLWSQKWSEWSIKELRLEKDTVSLESRVPQWQHDLYTGSTVAIVAGGVLTLIPGTQAIGIPLLVGGSIGLATAAAGTLTEVFVGGINEIEQVIPDSTLTNKINTHYTKMAGKDIQINLATNKLYKLYLGNFSGTDVNYVEFDESTFVFTEISWVTNGQVYLMEGDHIYSQTEVDDKYESEKPKDSDGLIGLIESIAQTVIMVVVFIFSVIIVVFLIKQGILTDPKKALIFFVVIGIIGLIGVIIYVSEFNLIDFLNQLKTFYLRI